MLKELYNLGDLPPLGHVPKRMYAAVIRAERFGEPEKAFEIEVVDVPPLRRGQALVLVMAAGVNYNNVWAGFGQPIDVIRARQRRGASEDFHIGGTDGAGVVWAVGEDVKHIKVGDPVILGPGQWDESAQDIRLGTDPSASTSSQAWGYETNYGSFGQFALVDDYQCHPKPERLTWEQAAAFLATGGTAYRQLCGWPPHTVQPGDPVLIWGGAGGLGSMAIQIVRHRGGIPVAVVSNQSKADYCLKLGAAGVIDRTEFSHWGRLPDLDDQSAVSGWLSEVRRFGAAIWDILGERRSPKIVLEHPGQDTLPTSLYVADNDGMVVTCGGTSGYNGDLDLRFLWIRQKRLQGSHGVNTQQARAVINLVKDGVIDPRPGLVLPFSSAGTAHQLLYDNKQPLGNIVLLVNAERQGLTSLSAAGQR